MTLLERIASNVKLMVQRPPRQQYGAICYRMTTSGVPEVLLLTSRDTGRWVIPKGWPMASKPSHEVAAQEAFEEAGVRGTANAEPAGSYLYTKVLDNGLRIPCRVQVHALKVEEMLDDFPEKDCRHLEWVSFDEAAKRVRESELKSLLRRFPAWLAAKSKTA
ncbi:NUDIX hydrolase [Allorhizobium borbori]|uniref:8-oxo-dGTP pyrophosphatase MutT (NUDIX family) n=1 Tax=Allorhizobium borbori TaxID=485907 RepID=A0A7W6K569_9HYPH|nr:NUDIX hydrolase [Allorhizobium borbori]MBB4104237.1 8-oxo-dGTP pyrophosphatase MutT (NUDIX family) [Allorhizobium borbori]PZU19337.1 MAG: DNA mismatch repair protein MutT [Shinella sp.]